MCKNCASFSNYNVYGLYLHVEPVNEIQSLKTQVETHENARYEAPL